MAHKKAQSLLVVSLLFLAIMNNNVHSVWAYPDYEGADGSLELIFGGAALVYNRDYDALKEDSIIHGLISRFGNERILLRISPTEEIVSVVLRDGKAVEYRIGEEVSGITVEVEVDKDTLVKIFYSEDPVATYSEALSKGEIKVLPRTIKLKVLSLVANFARGFMRLFGR